MSDRRTPSKSRRVKADCPHHDKPRRQPRDNWDGRHAPGHMGGEFNDSGFAEDCCQPDRPARIAARLEERHRRKDA